jgi:hypothetical protein
MLGRGARLLRGMQGTSPAAMHRSRTTAASGRMPAFGPRPTEQIHGPFRHERTTAQQVVSPGRRGGKWGKRAAIGGGAFGGGIVGGAAFGDRSTGSTPGMRGLYG